MLRDTKTLKGHPLRVLDGEIGPVEDLFFDDDRWAVRHLVVDAGTTATSTSPSPTSRSHRYHDRAGYWIEEPAEAGGRP